MEIVNPNQLKNYHSAQSEILSPHLTKPFFSFLFSINPARHPLLILRPHKMVYPKYIS